MTSIRFVCLLARRRGEEFRNHHRMQITTVALDEKPNDHGYPHRAGAGRWGPDFGTK